MAVEGYGEEREEVEEDGMPRISASAVEFDAAMRLAAMMRARCVRGLRWREVEGALGRMYD